MNNKESKFAFVTGTSSGIGKATANELLSRNWEVIGAARRCANINHKNYKHLNVDLIDLDKSVNEITKNLKSKISNEKYARIALVNNAAGAGELIRLEELDPEKLRDLYTLNVVIPVWLTGLFYKNKSKNSKLRVIDISSGAAHDAYAGMAAYCGTKASLLMSGKVFSAENIEDRNLAILNYEPGTVDTEMQRIARSQRQDEFPSVNMFKAIEAKSDLVDPALVAKEIVNFLENNEPGYGQKRFGVKH